VFEVVVAPLLGFLFHVRKICQSSFFAPFTNRGMRREILGIVKAAPWQRWCWNGKRKTYLVLSGFFQKIEVENK